MNEGGFIERDEEERRNRGLGKSGRLTDRQFIQASYPSIKSSQPDLKFMIREAQGVNARAFVRFGESKSHLDYFIASLMSRDTGSLGNMDR